MPVACQRDPLTPHARLVEATKKLASSKSELDRFYALGDAAKQSFVLEKTEDAKQYANDLLAILPNFQTNWNYGNAVHDANLVLGRIAVREGRLSDAKGFLLRAGQTPGSPQLNSFGPNMCLAQDLLKNGERQVVLDYFELCRRFWKGHDGRLDVWSQEVKLGKLPDFGANLVH